MARRRHGQGSVYQDGSHWVAAIDILTEDGSRRRKKFKRAVRADAEAALDAWLTEHPRHGPSLDGRAIHLARARDIGTHTPGEWYAKVRTYNGLCHYCKRPCAHIRHKDHVVPISRGGSDAIDNLVPACADCNLAKSTATGEEFVMWAEAIGFFDQPRRSEGRRRIRQIHRSRG